MASIYDAETAEPISLGLQGSDVCDEAWDTALSLSRDDFPEKTIVLEDDNGVWGFEGGCHHFIMTGEWDGSSW